MTLKEILKEKQLPDGYQAERINDEVTWLSGRPKMKKAFRKVIRWLRRFNLDHVSWNAEFDGTVYRIVVIKEDFQLTSPGQPEEL